MFHHAPNLAIQPLHQRDTEDVGRFLLDDATLCDHAQHGDAVGHFVQHTVGENAVDGHHVFFFVLVAGPQNLIHDVAVAGQKNQARRILIEPPDGKHAGGVVHVVHDVAAHARLAGARHAHRLIKGQVHGVFGLFGLQLVAVHAYTVARAHLVANLGRLAVEEHRALLDVAVGLAARAHAAFADEFIETGGGG